MSLKEELIRQYSFKGIKIEGKYFSKDFQIFKGFPNRDTVVPKAGNNK